ncbi:DNA-3-methyladenine glycosylase 2 family protein [Corticibacter populi]|uniref:DNA-3-methyladenine glycosylase II n=1 Tax=Corticibacter populi TaxID=1550736 RepID=A0A3M6QY08_9BURK|nr:DNA-3-methyladenine glycosylase 2 [Corticibacter populi]RMX07905.1 DNA-3-methyladenine glycosylase 2 family protein [Corticibacter populi]RZS35144.1 DNA-3-methyladenine glycosylase II [Corticibacter populi]
MHATEPRHQPLDPQLCEQARLSRDARFDGVFFTAVTSTGIYCRPVCPAPVPRRANVRYYPTAAAAEEAGFRPCLRCRPELSPQDGHWHRGDSALARALKLLDGGFLDAHSVTELAGRVHLGERQLRRLFVERLGAPPLRVASTRRLLFAKQLLTETRLPITEVALASGFGSLRRFNAAVQGSWRMPPGRMRRRGGTQGIEAAGAQGSALVLRMAYRPPYDFAGVLDFLRARAVTGVERVGPDSYCRTIDTGVAADAEPVWFALRPWPGGQQALQLQLHGLAAEQLPEVVRRIRRMFDLDADPRSIHAVLAQDAELQPQVAAHPGQRIPGGWDGFEMAVRAVLGQQVSVAAARTLAVRLVQRWGAPLQASSAARSGVPGEGLTHRFPRPEVLRDADLTAIGLPAARARTIRAVAGALLDGQLDFRPDQTLEAFVERWCALPGIGPWTAHYIAMRALGHPDAFPAGDLVLQKTLAAAGARLTAAALEARAQAWRPWRAYAVFHLWRLAATRANATASARAGLPRQPIPSFPNPETP